MSDPSDDSAIEEGAEIESEVQAPEQVESPEGSEVVETNDLENMILSTGIRVGTPVKTKYMTPFILKANPEGLY
ncbi:MAG TPA: 30S ribosomal protein S2, partial [Nitrososphaera sp.]|nr:30S ribosomal protein S2 [Nitrososphaera sp.]